MGYEIAKLDVADGDVLVVKVHGRLSDEQSVAVGRKVKDQIGAPDGVRVVVLDSTIDLSVVRLPVGSGISRAA